MARPNAHPRTRAGRTTRTDAPAHVAAGLQRHRAGDPAGAATHYQAALAADPANADALHLLGVLHHQGGDPATACDLLRRAAARAPGNAEIRSNLGAALHKAGDTAGAAEAFATATRIDPNHVDAHANLAGALVRLGRTAAAIDSFAAAQRLSPQTPRFARRLAELCLDAERLAEAADWFERYLALQPDDGDAHNNAAFACERLGRLTAAEAHYRKALALRPQSPEIANNLGNVLRRLGRRDEADTMFARALAAPLEAWEDAANRAGALCNHGETERALPVYEALIAARPADVRLRIDQGRALLAVARPAAAEAAFRAALALDAGGVDAMIGLADSLLRQKRPDEALRALERAVAAAPQRIVPQLWLCGTLSSLDRIDEAHAVARRAIGLPDFRASMFINPYNTFRVACAFDDIEGMDVTIAGLGRDGVDAEALSAGFLQCLVLAETEGDIAALSRLHRLWGDGKMAEAAADPLPSLTTPRRGGRIRVGFVSSDLRSHSVGRFFMPLIRHHDRDRLEIFCYTPHEAPDDPIQHRIREMAAGFRIVADLSHRDLAATIRADDIDVLFELNGFTGESRLKALAYRPAPVQVYWLGYPFTTGLPAMDYIMVDRDLASERPEWMVEKPLVMPGSWVCYDAFENVPVAAAPPVTRNGFVTFGSLNNPYKMTRRAIALWAQAMNRVPGSRFLLVRPECASATLRANLTAEFARNGVDAGRLRFANNKAARLSHFAYYDEIDLSLDTFPLTGGTTTTDALWMGVPVVTLVGPSLHQRISYAILKKAGLDDLCTRTPEAFVARAAALAGDVDRLRALRAGLRPALMDSPLCRGADFGREFGDLMTEVAVRHGLR